MIDRNQKFLLFQVLCTLIYPGSFDDQQQPQHQQQPHQDRRKHKHHNSHNNYNHRKHEPSTFTHNLPHNDFLTSKHRSRNTFGRRIMSIIELPLYWAYQCSQILFTFKILGGGGLEKVCPNGALCMTYTIEKKKTRKVSLFRRGMVYLGKL